MRIRSALLGAVVTLVLVLALGNEWALDNLGDGDPAFETRRNILFLLHWGDLVSRERGATIVRLVLLVVITAVLGGIAGRARPLAAFFGGWGAFLVAALVSAGIFTFLIDDFRPSGQDGIDEFTTSATAGTPLGMWLGWLVGLAVLLGALGQDRDTGAAPRPFPPPGAPGSGAPSGPGSYGAPAAPFGNPQAPTGSSPAPPGGGRFGTPPESAPSPPPPPAAPPADPGSPAGPVIGAPPDRTQVYGDPPAT